MCVHMVIRLSNITHEQMDLSPTLSKTGVMLRTIDDEQIDIDI